MLVIGGATSVGMALSLIRIKVLALLLGPIGVGLMGIYINILQTSTQLAGLGLGQSGVRRDSLIGVVFLSRGVRRRPQGCIALSKLLRSGDRSDWLWR